MDDQERQQPVGDTGRHEPRHIDAILDAELQRALDDPDPLRGIAQLTARWAAAFVLDPDGATRTKALGTERIARKLRDALPGGHSPLRTAVWEFLRPMLSPTLVALNHDAFITDESVESSVDLDKHRSASDLDELDLDDPARQRDRITRIPLDSHLPPAPAVTRPAREGRCTCRVFSCLPSLSSTFGSLATRSDEQIGAAGSARMLALGRQIGARAAANPAASA